MKYLIYDLEIAKSIPIEGEPRDRAFSYCDGWRDFKNMGISLASCLFVTDQHDDLGMLGSGPFGTAPYLFMHDNKDEFRQMLSIRDLVLVGFNNQNFDDRLLAAQFPDLGLEARPSWDLLAYVWRMDGLDPTVYTKAHAGYSLNAFAVANGYRQKRGSGASAPMSYQAGRYGALVNYGVYDLWLTALLLVRLSRGALKHPKDPRRAVQVPDGEIIAGMFPDLLRATYDG